MWAAPSTCGPGVNRTAIFIRHCHSDSSAITFTQCDANPIVHPNANAIIHCDA